MKIQTKEFRVAGGDVVDLMRRPTKVDPAYHSKKNYKKLLKQNVAKLSALQRLHYASNQYALLLIFQAMDAAGKDGAIRHVMSGSIHKGAKCSASGIPAPWNWSTIFCGARRVICPSAGAPASLTAPIARRFRSCG